MCVHVGQLCPLTSALSPLSPPSALGRGLGVCRQRPCEDSRAAPQEPRPPHVLLRPPHVLPSPPKWCEHWRNGQQPRAALDKAVFAFEGSLTRHPPLGLLRHVD